MSFKFANKLSKSSSGYNHNDDYVDMIINDLSEFAKKQWKNNIDIVMVGHYHQEKIISEENKKLVFLGDWLDKFTVTLLNDDGVWQGNWKQFIELS